MLRTALNFSLEDHIYNVDLCGELPRIGTKVQERRMALAWSLHVGRNERKDEEVEGEENAPMWMY